MRAPQFGKVRQRMPVGPNPEAAKGLRVKPFANVFALVEGLGVVSLHQTEADAQTALEGEIERRSNFNNESATLSATRQNALRLQKESRSLSEGISARVADARCKGLGDRAAPAETHEPHDAKADR
jgi:hypothetical protein